MRLARTEINMAYRSSDSETANTFDAVVGIEVHLSNNHNCKGVPEGQFYDICDELQGKYPRDFKFTGWHPACYSNDSEVLTEEGWKLFDSVQYNDLILSLNPKTKETEWVMIEDMQCYEYKGDLIRFYGEDIDCLVTPEHRMPYYANGVIGYALAESFTRADGGFMIDRECKRVTALFGKEPVAYHGNVYDLTLERNHIMYIRRNGKCFWGSNCRCFITYILKSDEEFWRDLEDGVNRESVNTVKDVPENFKQWVVDNQERIERSEQRGTLPYFIRDNEKYVDRALDIELENPLKPSFTYTPYSSKLSMEDNVKNLLNAAEGAYGRKKVGIYRWYFSKPPYDYDYVWDLVKEQWDFNDKAVFASLNHLNELSSADLSAIPSRWRDTFNELVKKINAQDVSKGYFGVYPEIEHAYNIYKLSTNQDAIAYGLDKLSDKTPYVLFTEFRTKIPGYPIPKKEFFDVFDRFVPLFTGRTSGAYFEPSKKHVYVGLSSKDYRGRLEASAWYREGLMYHEYGHALDDAKALTSSLSKITKIYENWQAEILKDDGKSLEQAIRDILKPARVEFQHWWNNSEEKKKADAAFMSARGLGVVKATNEYNETYRKLYREHLYDLEEQLGALSDCLEAALGKSRTIDPRGHKGTYFKFKENQLAEFLAHTSENYWKGNPYFQQLAPDLYEAMIEYFKLVK